MDIRFVSPPPPAEEGGTLVVAVLDEGRLGAAAAKLDGATDGAVRRSLQAAAGGKLGRGRFVELLGLPPDRGPGRVLLMGLGRADGASTLDLEIVGAGLAVKLAGLKAAEASVAIDPEPFGAFGPAELAARLAAGARLRAYRFDRYRTAGKGNGGDEEENDNGGRGGKGLAALTFVADDPAAAEAAHADLARVVDGVVAARDLVSEPANVLHPRAFADRCEALGELGLDVQVLDRAALGELGMNALLGVAQGSAREPYVVVMRWTGGPAEEPPVALVGKGVCFDTGGISIKPSAGMEDMK
ncbi:MAG TPA: M17 family peptidase N-terminal domain-containing protein, partial [Geminicoccaceae bacterium]|nr:M17 family peptidase N-terminal domain-containing protein [Geminicoccaceae bacterium]